MKVHFEIPKCFYSCLKVLRPLATIALFLVRVFSKHWPMTLESFPYPLCSYIVDMHYLILICILITYACVFKFHSVSVSKCGFLVIVPPSNTVAPMDGLS